MTDEQINQRIAEACGWTDCVVHPEFGLMGTPPDTHGLRTAVDYYTVDLNAMAEAEKVLVNQFTTIEEAYWRNLQQVKPHPIYATARQRAEAFLRTLGKWEATDKESLTVQTATTEQSSVDHLRDATKMMEVQP
jgi:hypothetical protein